jgi:hypothetical protein
MAQPAPVLIEPEIACFNRFFQSTDLRSDAHLERADARSYAFLENNHLSLQAVEAPIENLDTPIQAPEQSPDVLQRRVLLAHRTTPSLAIIIAKTIASGVPGTLPQKNSPFFFDSRRRETGRQLAMAAAADR